MLASFRGSLEPARHVEVDADCRCANDEKLSVQLCLLPRWRRGRTPLTSANGMFQRVLRSVAESKCSREPRAPPLKRLSTQRLLSSQTCAKTCQALAKGLFETFEASSNSCSRQSSALPHRVGCNLCELPRCLSQLLQWMLMPGPGLRAGTLGGAAPFVLHQPSLFAGESSVLKAVRP